MKKSAGIAIDLGGTKVAGALICQEGQLQCKKSKLLQGRKGKEVGFLVIGLIQDLLAESKSLGFSAHGVGIAVPGIYYTKTGTVWAPNIPAWENFPLLTTVKESIGEDVPVTIDSDRACYVLGEAWQGAAINARHAIYLAIGTGIGAGIMIDGKVLRGANDIAGAVGWMALTSPYIPEYSRYGCFEYRASGVGLARMASQLVEEDGTSLDGLEDLPLKDITAQHVFEAYERGDEIAAQVVNTAIAYWGKAAANLISLFNPDMIIFGGGVFGPGVQLLDQVYQEAQKWAQPVSIKETRFVPSTLGKDAGLFGAAFLIHQSSMEQ